MIHKSTMSPKSKSTPILIALLSLLFASASFADQWLHVKVESGGDENVTVNLPLSLMEAAVAMIPDDITSELEGEIEVAIDDVDMDWQDLRSFWQAVKDTPETTFATVQTRDEMVVVKKEGEMLKIVTEATGADGAEVNVQLPMQVVDALFSGPDGTLSFSAAIRALADQGAGHLVQIRDGEDTVRVWIDYNDTAD